MAFAVCRERIKNPAPQSERKARTETSSSGGALENERDRLLFGSLPAVGYTPTSTQLGRLSGTKHILRTSRPDCMVLGKVLYVMRLEDQLPSRKDLRAKGRGRGRGRVQRQGSPVFLIFGPGVSIPPGNAFCD